MGRNNLVYSNYGNTLTKGFEQCRLTAYWDAFGKVWTIGWGHTGPDVFEGLVWTQDQADIALAYDEQSAVNAVNNYVTVILTQHEFDALVDFTYNAGAGNLEHSTMLAKLNAGDYAGAAQQLLLWDHSGGQVLAGLLKRRTEEMNEFNTGDING
jgi:lysozyme